MLTEPIRGLLQEVAEHKAGEESHSGSILEINEIISAAAGLYEKVRYLVDYRDEHTIRRAAIERILKRHVIIEKKRIDGATLLQELVESQYLLKEHATEAEMLHLDHVLERFLELQVLSGRTIGNARKLLSLAASEIESHLSAHEYVVDRASVDAMYKIVRPHVLLTGFSEQDVDVQVYCACKRSLLSSDDAALTYSLWLMSVPEWKDGTPDLTELAARLPALFAGIERSVSHPLQWQIAPRIKNESIYFRIFRELVMFHEHDAETIISDQHKLDAYVTEFLRKRYERENERIKSSGIRAVIYLFMTKMTVALVVEVPYEKIFLGGIHYVPLMTNLFFHPALLFALTRRVRSLGSGNTEQVLKGMHRIAYTGEGRSIRIYTRYTEFTRFFASVYALLVLGVFGAIITILTFLEFSVVSTGLFLFFLALVSYFAFRIRTNARRWRVSGQESTLTLIANLLAVPIIRVGRWLSRTFSSINIVVVIMDFLIETPFRKVLNFSHQFILYLKEKAEGVY